MTILAGLGNEELVTIVRTLSLRSCEVEADLIVHLGEVDERRLYLDYACASMFRFCVSELGYSEAQAYNRVFVARAARQFPAMIDALREGKVHLAGLRTLAPHLTAENHGDLLGRAAGKTRDQIAHMVAEFVQPRPHTGFVVPAGPNTNKVQFYAPDEFCNDLREARDLLKHQVPDGDLAKVLDLGLKLLVAQLKKQKFAAGRKKQKRDTVPAEVKREVYERDGGRCAFVDERGKRCEETGGLEYDHIDGYARTGKHDAARMRLLCRAHNEQHAERMYGAEVIAAAKGGTCPGTSSAEPPP